MITVFNRKELLVTYSMQKQADVKSILIQNNIDYDTKVINRKSPSPFSAGSRAYTGVLGENLATEYEYIIYVHKSDYEKAVFLTNSV